jgi:Amt family ammonium transporter
MGDGGAGGVDLAGVVTGVAGALLLRVGLAVHAAGMCRAKNAGGMLMRHLCDLCLAVLAFWGVGFAIVASGGSVIGLDWRWLLGPPDEVGASVSAMAPAAVLIATGIVPGVLAERARFWASLWPGVLLAGLVVPAVVLWTAPGGWVGRHGYADAGGASRFHLTGALAALVGAYFVGARTGKFNRDGSSSAIPGHSLPLAFAGVFVALVGFVVFLGSVGGAGAMVRTMVAGAAAGIVAVVFSQMRYYKPDVHLTCAAVLGGLVAITAGAGSVNNVGALVIGSVAGLIVPLAILLLDVMFRIDDPAGGIATHGVAAVWGMLACPFFLRGVSFGVRMKVLLWHSVGIIAIAVFTIGLSVVLWTGLRAVMKLRASEADEFDGLDLAEHDVGAYPDFQQTMIKSYHLREV